MLRRLPNILTGFRILLVPVFVYLMVDPSISSRLWAAAVFILASFTDWLDGYLARLYKVESILGKLLDPLADKVLVMSALVMLAANKGEPRIASWVVVIFLARDMIVTGLRSMAALKNVVVAADTLAKYKTAFTMLALIMLLVAETYQLWGFELNFFEIGHYILYFALILSIYTGLVYAVKLRKIFVD